MLLSRCSRRFWGQVSPIISTCTSTLTFQGKEDSHAYGYKPQNRDIVENNVNNNKGIIDENTVAKRHKESNVYRYIEAYRQHGHKKANINPLTLNTDSRYVVELDPLLYGLEMDTTHDVSGLFHTPHTQMTIDQLTAALEREYCGTISAEFTHLSDIVEREWFAEKFERKNNEETSRERKMEVATLMSRAEALDKFLAVKFSTLKRYSGEGNETLLVLIDELMRQSVTHEVSNIVMCMAHRGRLNLLTCLLDYPPVSLFQKVKEKLYKYTLVKGMSEFVDGTDATGDVLSHAFTSVDLVYDHGSVHMSFLPNPSHLEIINPVAAGKTRSIQQTLRTGPYNATGVHDNPALCVQIHGDAAVTGQGVVAETMTFADCPHFTVGGTIHIITNNQIGFTTDSLNGRSSTYCSDFAKVNACPVIHVNADDPEAVLAAARIAVEYRSRFHRDIVVDLVCYRRWGHNELDEPSFTQPIMYSAIRARPSLSTVYMDKLTNAGMCTAEDIEKSVAAWMQTLNEQFSLVDSHKPHDTSFQKQWSGYTQAGHAVSVWDSGVSMDLLKFVGAKSVQVPDDMTIHPTLLKSHVTKRLQRVSEGTGLDWATAEALAIGSLLLQGYNARISGQDVARGTFSHRHAALIDQNTDQSYVPLNHMVPQQTCHFELANSILSEEAVMAFEYGFSIDNPDNLVMWEAQFGDFFNGAQIVIDTFLSSGETKWQLQSGLVLLLPHGYDGAGPEHTSCRMERFLQLTDSREAAIDGDSVNFSVVNPTTPAQYFHLLRRQMIRNFRKPLVVVAPKVLLKHPLAVSTLQDMVPGTSFLPVLPDITVHPDDVVKLVFCSGKHFYTLAEQRTKLGRSDIAFVRLETLCPFPTKELTAELNKYKNVKEYIWCQEEHRNMGAWTFVKPRFENILRVKLDYVGRREMAAPAVGIGMLHQAEVKHIHDTVFTT